MWRIIAGKLGEKTIESKMLHMKWVMGLCDFKALSCNLNDFKIQHHLCVRERWTIVELWSAALLCVRIFKSIGFGWRENQFVEKFPSVKLGQFHNYNGYSENPWTDTSLVVIFLPKQHSSIWKHLVLVFRISFVKIVFKKKFYYIFFFF